MKILFLGDYSNFHAALAKELRRRGMDVTVVSNGSGYMDTDRDIDLSRGKGFASGFRYLYRLFSLLPRLHGFDIVQIISPGFLQLRPGKIKYFFDDIKRNNGSIFLSLAGNDSHYTKVCTEGEILRYSEFRIGKTPTPYAVNNRHIERQWLSPSLSDFCKYIYDNVDGATSCLYEYDIAARSELGERLAYIGIPVETSAIKYIEPAITDKVNIFVGIKREMQEFKGTGIMLQAALEAERMMPGRCRVTKVENLPYTEYITRLAESHILLDQLYSYTPATNALGAMAMGKVAVSGGEPEYYDFIGESELRPIINADPAKDNLTEQLMNLINDPERIIELGKESRRFVERHNDSRIVVDRLIAHWQKIIGRK